ncbi:MAG: FtsH protease activity modulator HflK [Candidatus Marinimicrobia bacterium]|nr:FtsH protease activity modulator HflK [Candidatus Neomarinimicrobiota bacterium]
MSDNTNFTPPNINIPPNLINGSTPIFIIIGVVILLGIFTSAYKVDANENGVVLRFGKYIGTTTPGLKFKLPLGIDKVYKIQVARQYKEEFGFRTRRSGTRTQYSTKNYQDESWMLTGDLNIAEVEWIVQYNIKDPKNYLFKVKDPRNTIRDVSETVMSLMVGDRSFTEALQSERENINIMAKEEMQKILDSYDSGISIQLVQLQGLVPPGPVSDSFNEVNRAKQEQEAMINEARKDFNKIIYQAEGKAKRLVKEAEGYAIQRTNEAKGDVEMFNNVSKEYKKSPQITKDRLYIETMRKVLSKVPNKIIIDAQLENFLPLLNLQKKGN